MLGEVQGQFRDVVYSVVEFYQIHQRGLAEEFIETAVRTIEERVPEVSDCHEEEILPEMILREYGRNDFLFIYFLKESEIIYRGKMIEAELDNGQQTLELMNYLLRNMLRPKLLRRMEIKESSNGKRNLTISLESVLSKGSDEMCGIFVIEK